MDVWAEHVTKRGVMDPNEKCALQPPQAHTSFLLNNVSLSFDHNKNFFY